MALNFPKNPALNQEYSFAGTTWVWDGGKWTSKGMSSGLPIFPDADGNVVITGTLVVNDNITSTGDVGATNLALSGNAQVNGDLSVSGDIDDN